MAGGGAGNNNNNNNNIKFSGNYDALQLEGRPTSRQTFWAVSGQ